MRADEKPFIKKLAQKDPATIRELLSTYTTRVYNTVMGYVKNVEDAEELTQDVFFAILESAGKFQHQSSLSTWIYRIAVNKSLDFLRFKGRKKRSGIVISLSKKEKAEENIQPLHFEHPGAILEKQEKESFLFRAIDQLPETQKTAIILAKIEGLPQKEVAEIMEISVKAVESLLQRGKGNLRKILSKIYDQL